MSDQDYIENLRKQSETNNNNFISIISVFIISLLLLVIVLFGQAYAKSTKQELFRRKIKKETEFIEGLKNKGIDNISFNTKQIYNKK